MLFAWRTAKVLGNPSGEVLGKFKRNGAAHVDFNFAAQKGIGVTQLIPHASSESVDLITKVQEPVERACPLCRVSLEIVVAL